MLVCILLFSACFTQKKATQPTPVPTTEETNVYVPPTSETKEEPQDTIPTLPTTSDEPEKEVVVEEVNIWDIAVLLPFNTRLNNLSFDNDTIHKKSKMALDFYEGVQIALEELKQEGLKFNIHVYDTESNKDRTKILLNNPKMKEMDLLIGPLYNKPLEEASNFSRANKIFMISPISPKTSFIQDNPYYINASSDIRTHCDYLFNHFVNESYSNITLVHQNKPGDYKLAQHFLKYAPIDSSIERTGSGPYFNQLVLIDKENDTFSSYLSQYQPNIFVVPSVNEFFVSDVLRRLYSYSDRYEIIVYGMPNWYKFESIDPAYYEGLNIYFTNNFYQNDYSPLVKQFRQRYKSRMNSFPSEYACKAYDIMKYFGQMLNQYKGETFRYGVESTKRTGAFTGFKIEAVFSDTADNINLYENKYLHLLNYQNFQLQKKR